MKKIDKDAFETIVIVAVAIVLVIAVVFITFSLVRQVPARKHTRPHGWHRTLRLNRKRQKLARRAQRGKR